MSSTTPIPRPGDSGGQTGTARVKRGMAHQLKGGVIMDVVDVTQAKIAEDAGAVAVMALERVPADIRAQGGVARMSDPDMIDAIISAVSIPVMAKARIGHFVEARVLQSLGVDYVDESEVLTPADYAHHIDKWAFTVPFVCGATNLGEALRRISEGAAMLRHLWTTPEAERHPYARVPYALWLLPAAQSSTLSVWLSTQRAAQFQPPANRVGRTDRS